MISPRIGLSLPLTWMTLPFKLRISGSNLLNVPIGIYGCCWVYPFLPYCARLLRRKLLQKQTRNFSSYGGTAVEEGKSPFQFLDDTLLFWVLLQLYLGALISPLSLPRLN
jgi:hypothetical protein